MAVRIAQGLIIASLVLLLIYGADEGVKQGKKGGGFLPLDVVSRGIGFGFSPVVLSTVAFFVSTKEKSSLVSVLLLVNGVLIMIGGIMPIVTGSIGLGLPVLGMGIWILALGIIKSLRARAIKTV